MKNDVEYEFESCVPFIAERFYLSSSTSEEGGRETSRRPARHEIVCRHWLRGICIKESRCDFLHVFDDSRMPYCRNQKRHGRCVDQVLGFCALKHDQQEVRGAGSNRTRERSPAMTQSTNGGDVCMRYLFGYCSHGPACHQQHIRLERRDLPLAPLPDWYLSLIISSYDGHQSGNAVHQSAPSGAGGAGASGLLLGVPALSEEERQQSTQTWTGFVERLTGRSTAYHPLEELLPTTSLCPNGDSNRGVGGPKIRCFVIKSGKIENILTSVQRGIWATGKNNQEKLRQAWLTCDHVVLLMSANESGGFQGYARMASGFDETLYPRIWGSFSNKLSPNFRVQWLKQAKLDFEALSAFTNPWNENRPLKKSRDGQEMPLEIAEAICSRLYNAPSEDLLLGTPLQDLPRIDHLTFFNLSPKEQLVLETKIGLRQPPSAPQTVTPQNLVYSFNKNDLGIIPRPIQPPQPVNLPNGMRTELTDSDVTVKLSRRMWRMVLRNPFE
ncbi:YT521-B-like domain protein [Gregarina niphandrodes]|uniref:YT521-B-like domain protein n=1 Tax=Gregarina niphandrodes TaxID=110365 RepID=A0A023B4A3_GRENI|nr:YT521-B-like domain protein [Gregarina niphandrodes]EZG56483.1 YT521-B-like domain protein [Gregarina niphandrodes]|eukprot:XP_011131258.1 YT521-B-like domain protein [Gregarina niphandrodes]